MRDLKPNAVRRSILRAAVGVVVGGFPGAASAQPPAQIDNAIYDVNRLNGYTARVAWRIVYNVENSTSVCRGEGSAIFLGGSLFLTAAHVIDQHPKSNDCAAAGKVNPLVEFGSTTMEAKIIAIPQWYEEFDSIFYPEGMDLALLQVDKRMMQPERVGPKRPRHRGESFNAIWPVRRKDDPQRDRFFAAIGLHREAWRLGWRRFRSAPLLSAWHHKFG
ncbi:MAG TPA: hypothetical protein VGU20_09080 [Stellaceae bacterium]|nr:hypothetical protein [Stellaceae bacterium]